MLNKLGAKSIRFHPQFFIYGSGSEDVAEAEVEE